MNTVSSRPKHAPVLLVIIAICAGLELLSTLLALPAFGSLHLREWNFVHGAFWPGLMEGWSPVYPLQPAAMYLTHAFLHGSVLHMVFNMLIFLHLGRECVERLGTWGFLLLFGVTAMGGGACYALLASSGAPMVGTSGVVFGLFGATAYWDFQRRKLLRASLIPVRNLIIGLVVMNVAMMVMMQGALAWQSHLGGFVAGVLFAWIATPSIAHRYRPKQTA